jgi:glycosyltransferase involved in cell wall biosynthesis
MKKPSISVIIPVYNRSRMLKEALESVFIQKYEKIEVIVVDDGSEDNSAETAGNFGADVLSIAHCGFPGKVRNIGVEKAEGDLLAFLDSDDLWKPGKLTAQTGDLASGGELLCHTREIWDREGKTVSQRKQRHRREGDVFTDALKKCIIGPSTVLMDKKLFVQTGGFREDLEIAEDYELWLRITNRHTVSYIDKPFVIKRAGNWPQLSEKYGMIEYFRIQALKDLVDSVIFTKRNHAEARTELLKKIRIYAAGCDKRGKKDEAEEYRKMALEY